MSHVRVVAVKSINNAAANKAQLKISEGGDASPHRPFLFLSHHLGLQFLRSEGFLLRPHVQAHVTKFGFQFIIARSRCQSRFGALARLLVVIIIITLVKQHKRDVVLGV